jgi:hypothetical protein
MKIRLNPQPHRQGSALLVILLTCVIIGFTLASYLVLVSSQNRSVMRSMAWNSAIPVLEAGVEEALTQLRYWDVGTRGFAGQDGTTPNVAGLHSNGWIPINGHYAKEIRIGDSYCQVAIEVSGPTPVIYSTAYVPAPLSSGIQTGMIQGQIGPSLDESRFTQGFLKRSVRVQTLRNMLFARGMVAEDDINLNGNNVDTDSYNSRKADRSTNGKYDPAKRGDRGDIATNSGLINSLNIGNANIMGKISTGQGGTAAIGPSGIVGDLDWHNSGGKGMQAGAFTDDMNVVFDPVEVPFTSGYAIPAGRTIEGVDYTYVLSDGNYMLSSFGGTVLIQGDVVLHVTESISFSDDDTLVIAPGGSLQVFMSGQSATFSGNATWNENGSPLQLQYFGLPGNTSVSISGNGAFSGTIYAPSADLTLNGGGKDNYDFSGASISKTVKMNGHVKFHYDEALSDYGLSTGYIPVTWDEI